MCPECQKELIESLIGWRNVIEARGSRFESSDWQSLYYLYTVNCIEKTKIKKKNRGRKWHISLKWWVFFSIEKDKRSLKIAYTYQRLRSHTCQWWKRGLAIMTSETRLGFFWSQRFLHKSSPNVCWFLDF